MITLISSKKIRVYKIMRNTVTMKSNIIEFISGEFLPFETTVCRRNIIGDP